MAQVNPLQQVTGKVVAVRQVDVPAKPAIPAQHAGPDGPAKPARPAELAWSYNEVSLSVQGCLEGQLVDFPALLEVTLPDTAPVPDVNTEVHWHVECYPSARPNGRGGWFRVVTRRFVADVVAAPELAAAGARRR